MSDIVLSAQGLVKRFGGITATNNVTLNLRRGARHALIGPNGAGKTTLINLLTGVLGAIVFKLMQDFLSAITPQYWTFWLGLFLVVLVLVGRDRLLKPWSWFGRRRAA